MPPGSTAASLRPPLRQSRTDEPVLGSSRLHDYINSLYPTPTSAVPATANIVASKGPGQDIGGNLSLLQDISILDLQEASGKIGWQHLLSSRYDLSDLVEALLHSRAFCRRCDETEGWLLREPMVVEEPLLGLVPGPMEMELPPPLEAQSAKKDVDLVERMLSDSSKNTYLYGSNNACVHS